jgi:hypothetical protein
MVFGKSYRMGAGWFRERKNVEGRLFLERGGQFDT